MKIFVIIPAYNEITHIGAVVDDVKQYIADVIVVDDCSKDGTAMAAAKHGAVVLRHVVNRGQGAALQTGNEYALEHGAEIIAHFDADGQHQAKDISRLIEPVILGAVDVVFGSRFLEGARGEIPLTKRFLILPMARLVNRLFTGLWLSDGHNGLRAMNRKATELVRITQDRMAHNTEIPSLVARHGLQLKEVPMDVVYHKYGRGVFDGVRILWDLVKGKVIH